MKDFERLMELLGEKKAAFREFEAATEEMLDCPVDRLEQLVDRREQLIARIDSADEALAALMAEDETAGQMRAAAQTEGNRGDLPEALWPAYDLAADIRAIISRLVETETQAAIRLRLEQQRTLDLIKTNNRGVGAQAAKFVRAEAAASRAAHTTEA